MVAVGLIAIHLSICCFIAVLCILLLTSIAVRITVVAILIGLLIIVGLVAVWLIVFRHSICGFIAILCIGRLEAIIAHFTVEALTKRGIALMVFFGRLSVSIGRQFPVVAGILRNHIGNRFVMRPVLAQCSLGGCCQFIRVCRNVIASTGAFQMIICSL